MANNPIAPKKWRWGDEKPWQEEGPHIVPDPPPYCSVEVFGIEDKLWTYLGPESLRVGDVVVVPFGVADFEVYGQVKDLHRRYRGPMPIKQVLRTVDIEEEKTRARSGNRPTP